MSTAIDNYIYLTQTHMMKNIGSVESALVNKLSAKEKILNNAISAHDKRIQEKKVALLNSKYREQIEDLLTGDDWLGELQGTILNFDNNNNTASQAQFNDMMAALEELKISATQRGKRITDFKNALARFTDSLTGYLENGIAQKYYDSVIGSFKSSAQFGAVSVKKTVKQMFPGASAENTSAARMLGSLATSYSGKAFRILDNVDDGNAQDVMSVALGKMISLREGLNSTYGKQYLRNLSASDKHVFYKSVQANVLKWTDDFAALAEEIAVRNGLAQAGQKVLSELSKVKFEAKSTHRYKTGGSVDTAIIVKEDDRLKNDLAKISQNAGYRTETSLLNSMGNTGAKADVYARLSESDKEVVGGIGISVKKIENVDWNKSIIPVDIKIQENTPLLTLFLREAGLNYNDLVTFINVGAALPVSPWLTGTDSRYESRFATDWETIKEGVETRAFYACLAGMGGKNDFNNVFYMSVDGRMFSIKNLLNYARDNINTTGFSINMNSKLGKMSNVVGNGLDRSTYQKVNQDNFLIDDNRRSLEYSQVRSNRVRLEAMSIMQATKITMSMHLENLKELVN